MSSRFAMLGNDLYTGKRTSMDDLAAVAVAPEVSIAARNISLAQTLHYRSEPVGAQVTLVSAEPQDVDLDGSPPTVVLRACIDATAVTAVKLGAIDYLSKPADADEVFAALTREGDEKAVPPENPMSADRVRWEHIQRVYELCDRNVSETARRLKMHRRTLQRILAKRSPR